NTMGSWHDPSCGRGTRGSRRRCGRRRRRAPLCNGLSRTPAARPTVRPPSRIAAARDSVSILLMATLFGLYPFLRTLYADGGYQGPQFQQALKQVCEQINVEIVKRSDVGKFVVLPKRWIVERTIGWLNRCRRLAKDWECLNRNGLAFLRWAS